MSKRRLGPRGVVGEPKAKTVVRTSFIVRWTGWQYDPDETFYITFHRGHADTTTNKSQAKSFASRAEAVKFCKEHVRNGRFGGDWRSVTKIEQASGAAATPAKSGVA